jgi:hypothetical protein
LRAGKLEYLKALKLASFQAFWLPSLIACQPPSLKPMTYELSAMSYLPDT